LLQTSFLVIGSGIAGLSAALTLTEHKGNVLIITKSNLLDGSSRYAQAGIAAVRNLRNDSFAKHESDTLSAGCNINNRNAVKFLVKNAPKAVDWLEYMGVKFAPKPTREAAHSCSRVWNTKDSTGETIEKTLAKKVRANKNIKILTNTIILDLIVEQKICRGAIVRHGLKNSIISANQTFLATGGAGQLFARTTNPSVSVGDGIAVAHRASAKLKDLEFIQFHPTALVGRQKRLNLLSESLRGEGATLRNIYGERFIDELAPRDIVARAIFQEMQKGSVFLDFTQKKEAFLQNRFPLIWRETAKAGFNLAQDQVPIFPVAHYLCGGVETNLHGKTSVKNLFAIGEVARTGLHGANRLASNSLAEAVVFGRAAGHAAQILKTTKLKFKISKYFFDSDEDRRTLKIIRETMWNHVGIVRTRTGLQSALKILRKLKPRSQSSINAVETAKLITMATLSRKKSLGAHFLAS